MFHPIESRKDQILNLGFKAEAFESLKGYFDFLWATNQKMNLFSRKMTELELVDQHFLDCLLPLKYFPTNISTATELGSGGGLPGIIYALQFPQIQFRLFEKSPKKCDFLNQCRKWASNIEVSGAIAPQMPETELIFARAFKPIGEILKFTPDHYSKKRPYFLLKGRKERIEEELLEAKKQYKELDAQILALPAQVMQRHLVLINSAHTS